MEIHYPSILLVTDIAKSGALRESRSCLVCDVRPASRPPEDETGTLLGKVGGEGEEKILYLFGLANLFKSSV